MGRKSSQSSPSLGNRMRNNMNTLREDELITSILSLDNSSSPGNSTLTSREEVTNLNYVKNKNSSKKESKKVDNEQFQGKNRRSYSKSPRSKNRKEFGYKNITQNEDIKVTAMDLDEDSDEDRRRSLNLQKEIEKEQEYQNQINMIYNSPSYFDQYSNDLQYQPGFHHLLQDQFILDPQILLQNPPMYFIPAPPPHFENPLVYFQSDEGSCDLSDSRATTCTTPTSSDSSEDESSHHYYNGDHENGVPFELDEELNNLVLSIITD